MPLIGEVQVRFVQKARQPMPKPVKSDTLKSRKPVTRSAKPASLHIDYLDIDGRQVPVTALYNPRAHRIIVRVDLAAGSVQVTSPSRARLISCNAVSVTG